MFQYQYYNCLDYLFNEHNEEDYTSNNAFKDARKLLNECKGNLLRKETNKIRKKLNKKEADYNSLKEKDSLTNEGKKVLKNIGRYLKNFENDLEKYQYNIIHGLDYLFNEHDKVEYYEPKEVESAFNGSYVLYESKGDEDNISIRPYLKDMIDKHKTRGEWKIQLSILFLSQIRMKLAKCIQNECH